MGRGLSRYDINDLEIVDAVELLSDGTTVIVSDVTVVSTTSATKRLVVSGIYLIQDPFTRIEPQDKVVLTGTSGADGSYTVASVVDDLTLEVSEAIADSTGGKAEFRHPPGALRTGFDPTGLAHTTSHQVQDAIKDLDGAITGGGITESQHEVLDTIVHEIDETSYDEVTYVGGNVSSYIVWETAAKLKKVREETYSYVSGKVSQVVTKQYDGTGVVKMTMTENYTYSGSKVQTVTRTKS